MQCWWHDGYSVILQHMKECRLSSIVKSQEEELSILVHKTERCKNIPEPADDPHTCCSQSWSVVEGEEAEMMLNYR